MDVVIPKEYDQLSKKARERIVEYCREVAYKAAKETIERDNRIILNIYMKMVCKVLHDHFGMGEDRLYLFLGLHKKLFQEQAKLVKSGTQLEQLNADMAKIFRKSGFPEDFLEGILGKVERREQ